MAQSNNSRNSNSKRTRTKDSTKKIKKKVSVLVQERVEYIDYKDVNLLQRFVSDRSKIRSRRVTSNTTQQQREIATAVKNAREMALMPYTKRVSTQRAARPPRDGDGGGGRDGREGRRAPEAVDAVEENAVEETTVEVGAAEEEEG